ncbi:MAG: hypothetical protein OEU95_02935, partial [Nitrospirota bacterium]|nr:hypothetical protein [Nitrospirota bacterium]
MFKKVLTLSSGSAIGKLFGIVREVLFAAFFGTSAVADAYRAAMTATITPIHLLTSETLSSTFIPQFRIDRKNNNSMAWALFNGIGSLTVFFSLIIGCGIYFFASTWAALLFPGFAENQFNLTVQMLKIMAWGVPLYSISALLISLEIGSGRFALAASRAFVQNIGIIIAILLAVWTRNPVWIAWGFTGTYIVFAFWG